MTEKEFEDEVRTQCSMLGTMLIQKNKSYGNSAFDPIRIFSKADTIEQIKVRIDDKLSRICRGSEAQGEDTEFDLMGYLMLMRVHRKHETSKLVGGEL